MQERPILFSTPMVQAIIALLKGMTRRTKGLERMNLEPNNWKPYDGDVFVDKKGRLNQKFFNTNGYSDHAICPYGKAGGWLWVRETAKICDDGLFAYKADYSEEILNNKLNKGIWKPSIHMPKTAARIWLQVEEIRVERLHDISEEDMISEGVLIPVSERNTPLFVLGTANSAFSFLPDGCLADGATPPTKKQILFAFWAELWCKINGRESWDSNPWVWVVKFKTLSTTGKPDNL